MSRIQIYKGFHLTELQALIEKALSGETLLILCPPQLENYDFSCLENADYPEQPIFGIFTTGTMSGAPRLVLYSRQNIESSLEGILSLFDRNKILSIFSYPQPFHTFGLTLGYVLAQKLGIPLHVAPGRYSRASHAHWMSVAGEGMLTLGTPTHFSDLIGFVTGRGLNPKASYSAIIGGARVQTSLWHKLQEVLKIAAPSIGYGATEACPGVTHLPPGRAPLEDGEIGYPLPNLTKTEIIPDSGVCFEGPSVCLAVVDSGKVEFPKNVLIRDEVVCRESDGIWIYRGRTDLVLNRGGQKFMLELIEELIQKNLGLEAVCMPVPDVRLGEDLGILLRGRGLDHGKLKNLIQEKMGIRCNPNFILDVDEFPMNSSHKLDRKKCAGMISSRQAGAPGRPIPVRELQDWLPHRDSAVWIDEVIRAGKDEGECRVILDPEARYATDGLIRPTSYVEWMAQAYGYALAQYIREQDPKLRESKPERTFLAAVKNLEVFSTPISVALAVGKMLSIHVRKTHQFGPIALIEGKVFDWNGVELARAELKLFAG